MTRGTTLIRLRSALMTRLKANERDGGVAMLTAILFMIIMAGVSTVIVGVVTVQIIPSYLDQKGTKTIYSAQAGIQETLGLMRSAGTLDVSGNVYGDPTKLPCALNGTPNGTVDGNSFVVTIAYYPSDPTNQSTSWLTTNKIACTTGTYGAAGSGPASTPKYALITSKAAASQIPKVTTQANRSITAVYKFKVSNVNVAGGVIYNADSSACLQAVTATAGSVIQFVAGSTCGNTSANSALQLWSYTSNWQLVLTSTTAGGLPGLCITGPATPTGATQNATLQACAGPAAPSRWNQLWSWTGAYTWQGEDQAIDNTSNYWLSPGSGNPIGNNLLVSTSVNNTLFPSALVGAGDASYNTHQLVNYLEFGRCADVTNENIGSSAMISYPCKQDPTGGIGFTWNQKWFYCEPSDVTPACAGVNAAAQQVYVYNNNDVTQKYCLTTPLTTAGNTFPYFWPCATSGSLQAQQTWNRVYNSGTYLTSYLMVDTYGRCLMANESYIFSGNIAELTSTTCNGSDAQKWNAPPTFVDSSVGGYREISGG